MSGPDTEKTAVRIVIAGGGTGGHLFPGVAIGQEFMARNPANEVLFVSTGSPFEKRVLAEAGFTLRCITSEAIKGRGVWNQLTAVLKMPKGVFESILILKNFKPDLTVGVGGYASAPLMIGAWLMGVKIVLHEQNILPGITNRMLAPLAERIYVSFENTRLRKNRSPSEKSAKKVRVTGNPVRGDILDCEKKQREAPNIILDDTGSFTVLVIGGSQGAHRINMAVMDAIAHLEQKEKFFFIHQTGARDETQVKNAYARQGVSCRVQSFFDDMASQYQEADLVICRAGASTVAEVTAIGKGVIFIPYPYAADNHQVLNARALADRGAAEMILEDDLNGERLAQSVKYYASNLEDLKTMAATAKNFGKPDAASVIVNDCYKLITGD